MNPNNAPMKVRVNGEVGEIVHMTTHKQPIGSSVYNHTTSQGEFAIGEMVHLLVWVRLPDRIVTQQYGAFSDIPLVTEP